MKLNDQILYKIAGSMELNEGVVQEFAVDGKYVRLGYQWLPTAEVNVIHTFPEEPKALLPIKIVPIIPAPCPGIPSPTLGDRPGSTGGIGADLVQPPATPPAGPAEAGTPNPEATATN